MVTAGVYLIARANPIYDLTETGRLVVAIIGVITLLIGAIIGCAYDDIKKVLAYSTVSQIGYMILAVGLGPAGYALGIFHLLTHGFFKAGLFLGAGSVMHAMHDEVDMRRFGGLRPVPADHLRHVRPGLPRADRLPVPVRATSPRTRSSRRRSRAAGLAGLGVRRCRHARRRAHRVLHDPPDAHDVLRREALEAAEPSRRRRGTTTTRTSRPPTMTAPMIVLAFGSVFAGFLLVRGRPAASWLAPSLGELRRARGRALIRHAVVPFLVVGVLRARRAGRLADGRAPPRPGRAARARVAAGAGRAPRPLRATRSTRRSSPGPAPG